MLITVLSPHRVHQPPARQVDGESVVVVAVGQVETAGPRAGRFQVGRYACRVKAGVVGAQQRGAGALARLSGRTARIAR
jgi:hypothetical protein